MCSTALEMKSSFKLKKRTGEKMTTTSKKHDSRPAFKKSEFAKLTCCVQAVIQTTNFAGGICKTL